MYGIIFTRTKADAQEVTERLVKEGYDIEALHGTPLQRKSFTFAAYLKSKKN
jgi:ATP-dependent RNA helicase DeaD